MENLETLNQLLKEFEPTQKTKVVPKMHKKMATYKKVKMSNSEKVDMFFNMAFVATCFLVPWFILIGSFKTN